MHLKVSSEKCRAFCSDLNELTDQNHYIDVIIGAMASQPCHCLLSILFRRRSKKISKLRVTGFCAGNSPVTDEFLAQVAGNAENVSIWWRHYDPLLTPCGLVTPFGDTELWKRWIRYWLVSWRQQSITWSNVDLSSIRSHGIHLTALSYENLNIPISEMILKILFSKSHEDLPGTNELIYSSTPNNTLWSADCGSSVDFENYNRWHGCGDSKIEIDKKMSETNKQSDTRKGRRQQITINTICLE